MIDRLEAVVLGIVQGATEYLPVSSSGHLVIFQHLFGLREPALLFDIVLHVATLVAVIAYYRRDLADLLRQSVAALGTIVRGDSWSATQARFPAFRLAWLIVLGTVPTALIGLGFADAFESLFDSLPTVGVMLWITGMVLLVTRLRQRGERRVADMKPIDAILVGLVQGLAITPGLSRSGSTIGVALLLGIERETAARFSFLLSVPSILGALLLKLDDPGGGVDSTAMTLGFVSALVTGYLCLTLLVRVVKRGKLFWFAPYCFTVGSLALLLAMSA